MSSQDPVTPRLRFRSWAYLAWNFTTMAALGLLCLPLLFTGRLGALNAIQLWARLQLFGLKHIVGMEVEVRGLEHLPKGAGLIAAKHQSQLDTIAPFAVLSDPCFVLKRELMSTPIFGWYAAVSGMIPVDRGGGSPAVRALSAAAADRLKHARQIVIFPEGTRKLPGAEPAYKSGVAALYRDLGFACIPLATNSGLYWPAKKLIYRPGKVVFEFLEPIPPGLMRAEFMRELEQRIETATHALMAASRA